jgi:hypothetical protein
MVSRLSKADIEELTDGSIPVSSIIGKTSGPALTPQQKKFAREIVKGKKKVDAYKEAYPNAKSPYTLTCSPYKLAAEPRIQQEIAALEAAERAQAYRTPSRLRALVVETLAQVATNPSERTTDRLRAAQLIGQITEVAAFTERKEVHTINSSASARAAVLEELKSLLQSADDVQDVEAKTLLDELQDPGTSGNIHYQNPDNGNVTTHNDNDVIATDPDHQDT